MADRKTPLKIGIDIGGTKTAVVAAYDKDGQPSILSRSVIATADYGRDGVLEWCVSEIKNMADGRPIEGIGISCGGPLDSTRGIIQAPPNLPDWDDVHITDYFSDIFGVPCYLENDANACAVAELLYGAGKGTKNMIFLTFGTGLGAGLILDGRLYRGTGGNAGEIGHVRLRAGGAYCYGKHGSAEGFCSGNGIRLSALEALKTRSDGGKLLTAAGGERGINAAVIARLADEGDEFCLDVYRKSGEMLGEVLSVLTDIFNPDRIVIGGVFMRAQHLLMPSATEVMVRECLPCTLRDVEVVPALLGEKIGDYSALACLNRSCL